jgi:hypothetical protein
MTVCAIETPPGTGRATPQATFAIAADGAYAARMVPAVRGAGRQGERAAGWCPERWTLDGPEPYAVSLPGAVPEGPGCAVLPLTDGRVLIARPVERRFLLALLYPTGSGTGEVALGAVDTSRLTLLPPVPGGGAVHALVPGPHTTTVWLVMGGPYGPQPVAEVRGRCSGGAWLDREGRLLALDRTERTDGGRTRTKTVAVDLGRGGEVTPLLQITEDSDDRLLLADPDSGLLLVRSDAPGRERLGWGVLGSHRPVRFPDALRPFGAGLTPFALQPGQVLQPEHCAVGLRVDGPNGTWVAVWRPAQRGLQHFPAPPGWIAGHGLWTRDGLLRLPCSTGTDPCGVAALRPGTPAAPALPPAGRGPGGAPSPAPSALRPVPLQQAPMARI